MIDQAEKDFIELILGALCNKGIKTIPFDNESFIEGINNAAAYFESTPMDNELKDKLSLLFVKQTTYGEYRRVQNIIEIMNGSIISLKNPLFIEATINMEEPYIKYLFKNNDLGLECNYFTEIADAFCAGAGI